MAWVVGFVYKYEAWKFTYYCTYSKCYFWPSGIDPPDSEKEKQGILALQVKERDVLHSVGYLQYLLFHDIN